MPLYNEASVTSSSLRYPIGTTIGARPASAFSGSYEVAQSDCAPGYIGIPGTIESLVPEYLIGM